MSFQQALRCLRGRKRVEKRADNLFAKLETIRGILDRIAQSQTDKMVRMASSNLQFVLSVLSVLYQVCFAGHSSISSRSGCSASLS